MSLTVIFDRILGRLRETDYEGGGSGGSDVPDPTDHLTVDTTPKNNPRYFADETQPIPPMTVTVTLRFDGDLVDADAIPNGWTHQSTGVYTKTLDEPGTVDAQQWSYTPGGVYEERTAVKSSPAKSLTVVYPAYWGIFPSNTVNRDITAVVAALYAQGRRVTANMSNNVVNVPNNTEEAVWLWIVTKGSATALSNEFNVSVVNDPVSGMEFTSPIDGEIDLNGYKAYVSKNSAAPGHGTGNVKLSINLAHTP